MKEFNCIEEIEQYFNSETNTYVFKDENNYHLDVKFNFSLNINANIDSCDIKAWDITAINIDACDIKAWDIDAENILFGAVCTSYNNIKCTKCEGRRVHAVINTLDGKLIYKQNKMENAFKVGDRVQFKSWEELKEEFGITDWGYIKGTSFNHETKLMGKIVTIKEINDNQVVLQEDDQHSYLLDMLKPIKKDLASEDSEDCVGYSLISGKIVKETPVFETIDEQIKYHEEKLAKLKEQKEKEKWVFTEDEKVILRNLPEEYSWIARDNLSDRIFIFVDKPHKEDDNWTNDKAFNYLELRPFQHLFQCIQWSDTELCGFRKYI